jgi:ribosomal protein S18 acetylase RimI-like enzyme
LLNDFDIDEFILMTIRRVSKADIPAMTTLLVHCAESMHQQGMSHWLNVYDVESVSQNLREKEVYVAEANDEVIGCIALGSEQASYYQDCWPDAPTVDVYITQLAVSPNHQGQGIGLSLMRFCMDKSIGKSILLDAVDHYPALIQFYQKLGFKIIRTGIGLGDKRHLLLLEQG